MHSEGFMVRFPFAWHGAAPFIGRTSRAVGLAGLLTLAVPLAALASDARVTLSDATAPAGSITLYPGDTSALTVTIEVTGAQVSSATFTVNRDYTLAGGTFTGSNPQSFSVPGRGTPATFTTTGTLTVVAGQAPGTFPLTAGVFAITNADSPGAKLSAASGGTYTVTVQALPSESVIPGAIPEPVFTAATPELDSVVLFGAGFIGLVGFGAYQRRKRSAAEPRTSRSPLHAAPWATLARGRRVSGRSPTAVTSCPAIDAGGIGQVVDPAARPAGYAGPRYNVRRRKKQS
jgi:hypothetical protein